MVRKASCEPPILDITEQRKRAIFNRLLSVKQVVLVVSAVRQKLRADPFNMRV